MCVSSTWGGEATRGISLPVICKYGNCHPSSLGCLQVTFHKCINFPSSVPHAVRDPCLYSVPGWGGRLCRLLPAVFQVAPTPGLRAGFLQGFRPHEDLVTLVQWLFLQMQSCAPSSVSPPSCLPCLTLSASVRCPHGNWELAAFSHPAIRPQFT